MAVSTKSWFNGHLMGGELELRRAATDDRGRIMELCRASLGWDPSDPDEELYTWKHDHNSFGPSPTWVAETDDGRIVGLRVFLRWRFVGPHGEAIEAVRAVDTATHPDYQGKGIFSRLTTAAVEELIGEGVGVVFNTPNDKSMPGYLKMGWKQVGAVGAAARVGGPRSLLRTARSRLPAELWSEETTAGVDVAEVLQPETVERLLSGEVHTASIRTDRSLEFLRWRYGFDHLHYRAFPLGEVAADGFILFRVRRRGAATEVAVCDILAPPRTKSLALFRALGALRRACGADYLLATTSTASTAQGMVRLAGLGPMLTWRSLARAGTPELGDLALTLGDLELF